MGTTERESMKYASGDDFRKALSDTLKRRYPDLNVDSLFKRVAMERFLARIAVHFGERALLKGGYALELRLARARSTKDLDLALLEIAAGEALEALRDAGELDLGDYFHYRIERNRRGTPQGAPEGGERLTVVPELGGRPFRPFPLDVGVGDALPIRTRSTSRWDRSRLRRPCTARGAGGAGRGAPGREAARTLLSAA